MLRTEPEQIRRIRTLRVSRFPQALVLLAFFASGAAALAYEVAWTRGLLPLLGSTTVAATLVLAVFVGALGVGARWGGFAALRSSRPLALYGVLEIAAAVWAVLAFGLIGLLQGPYVALASGSGDLVRGLLRAALAILVVAPGAFLLGATLPALVRHWVRVPGRGGVGTAVLYGVNTVGAVAGALLTGFFAIEALGVDGTLRAAAVLAGAVGAGALAAGRLAGRLPVEPTPLEPARSSTRVVALVAFLGGFVGLGVEVVGLRVLSFFLEGFTVTFAAMLGTFIAGLGVGSLLLGPRLARTERPHVALGALFFLEACALAFAAFALVPALDPMLRDVKAWVYADARDASDVAAGLKVFALVGSAVLLFLPALVWGATFPLAVRWAEREGDAPARAVGRVYLWNSLGSVAAPAFVTFVAIPASGPLGAWLPLGVLCLLATGALLGHARLAAKGPAALGLRWSVAIVPALAIGFLAGDRTESFLRKTHLLRAPGRTLLAAKTDPVTTASVVETGEEERILYTDDFPAAATGRHYRYMRMLGHLPVMLSADPSHALVIAFGTGTTAGAVAMHPAVKRIEVAEVSGAVLDLAPWFVEANRKVLEDPRVVVHRDDGRNVLLLHPGDLGVITLEPLMPYSPAGLPFYTREFYELARDRLAEGGVLCQWVPVHAMPVDMYAALVRTFFEVFPDGTLWFFEQSTALIGGKGRALGWRWTMRPDGRPDQGDAGLATLEALATACVATGRDVLAATAGDSARRRTVTDLDPWPEFRPTPRGTGLRTYAADTLSWLSSLVRDEAPTGLETLFGHEPRRVRQATRAGLMARVDEAFSEMVAAAPSSPQQVRALAEAWNAAARNYLAALERVPGEETWAIRRARVARRAARLEALAMLGLAARHRAESRPDDAHAALTRALRIAAEAHAIEETSPSESERVEAAVVRAGLLLRLGRCAAAQTLLEDDFAREPGPLVAEALVAVRAHRSGKPFPASPALSPWFDDAAPCAAEGVDALRAEIDRYRAALSGDAGAVRAAAVSLEAAAREHGTTADVAALLSALPPPDAIGARAVHAGLLDALADHADSLGALLGSSDAGVRRAALSEVAARRTLRYRRVVLSLANDADAVIRAAALEAATRTDDVEGLRSLVDRLLDPVRDVRVAAATALHALEPEILETYDPDAPEEQRRRILEELRKKWGR